MPAQRPLHSRLATGLLVRGGALLTMGVVVLAIPDPTLRVMLAIGALSLLLVGLYDVGHAWALRHWTARWWLLALRGLVGTALGAILLLYPRFPALVIGLALTAWLLLQGFVLLHLAQSSARGRRTPFVLAALACFAPGIAASVWPVPTLLAVLYLAVGYALLAGLVDAGVALWLIATRHPHGLGGSRAKAA
jgi:uncharacterized membrane protein HdeD (DUF308 family)